MIKLYDNLVIVNMTVIDNTTYETMMPGLFETIGLKFGSNNNRQTEHDINNIK